MNPRIWRSVVCCAVLAGVACGGAAAQTVRPPATRADSGRAPDYVAAPTRDSAVRAVVERVGREYVDSARGAAMAAAIRARAARGEYAAITGGAALADSLTAHLHQVYRDVHLRVFYTPQRPPGAAGDPGAAGERRVQTSRAVNYGYTRAEILPGNIGVLENRGFSGLDSVGEAQVAAALTYLRNTEALIVDLRPNRGGDREAARFLLSYFLPDSVRLSVLLDRRGSVAEEVWTRGHIPGPAYAPTKPVYVLTSPQSVSAAESFAYVLQQRGRALVVGERTAGGAHGGRGPAPIPGPFLLNVPLYRPVEAISNTNWEGRGVRPDIGVPAERALDAARRAALTRLAEQATDATRRAQLAAMARAIPLP